MPAKNHGRGHVRRLSSGRFQLRYYDRSGTRHSAGSFPTKGEAWKHYDEVIKPQLKGRVTPRQDVTFIELVDTFLDRHVAEARTIKTLRHRLARPVDKFGDIPLVELEGMGDEIAAFEAGLPPRFRYAVSSAMRQAIRAGIAYGYLTRSPLKQTRSRSHGRSASTASPISPRSGRSSVTSTGR